MGQLGEFNLNDRLHWSPASSCPAPRGETAGVVIAPVKGGNNRGFPLENVSIIAYQLYYLTRSRKESRPVVPNWYVNWGSNPRDFAHRPIFDKSLSLYAHNSYTYGVDELYRSRYPFCMVGPYYKQ